MSEAIGFVTVLPAEARGPFMTGSGETSEATQRIIDEEVRQLIDTAHHDVTSVLTAHRDQLETLTHALLKAETLDEPDAYAAAQMPARPTEPVLGDPADPGSSS
jgi:cell division protease FtsH